MNFCFLRESCVVCSFIYIASGLICEGPTGDFPSLIRSTKQHKTSSI